MNRNETERCIDDILIPFADCFAWADFGASGNSCYDPYYWDSPEKEVGEAVTLAAVTLALKKYTTRHTDLAKKVAKQTGNKYVTYPWLRDVVSRLLAGTTYDELLTMARLSRAVKAGMQAKRLTEIHSIAEALS